MIECDDTNWPLAIIVVEEAMTREDNACLAAYLTRWLDRAKPFVLLRIFTSDSALNDSNDALRESSDWLEANATRIRAHLLGAATAVPRIGAPSTVDMAWLAGVPSRVFADARSAVAWLREEILAPAGMTVDL